MENWVSSQTRAATIPVENWIRFQREPAMIQSTTRNPIKPHLSTIRVNAQIRTNPPLSPTQLLRINQIPHRLLQRRALAPIQSAHPIRRARHRPVATQSRRLPIPRAAPLRRKAPKRPKAPRRRSLRDCLRARAPRRRPCGDACALRSRRASRPPSLTFCSPPTASATSRASRTMPTPNQ